MSIAEFLYRGAAHSSLTLLYAREVRSRFADPYRSFYTLTGSIPEIIAILHGKRDHTTILTSRLT